MVNINPWGVPSTYIHVSAVMLNPELYEAREWGPHVEWDGEAFVRKEISLDLLNLAVLYQFYMDMVNVGLRLIPERLEGELTCGRDRGSRGCGMYGRGGGDSSRCGSLASFVAPMLLRHRPTLRTTSICST